MKILLLAVVLLALPTRAAEQQIECPARYPVEEIKLPETGKWDTGLVIGQLPLEGAGMATGPLAQRAELRGSEQKIKSGFQTRFGFNRNEDPPEKWFLCYYGIGGSVQLARRVADTTTACTLTHEKKKFPHEPRIEVNCQ
jgi:hypothetical protein